MSSDNQHSKGKEGQGTQSRLSDREPDAFLGWLAEEPEPNEARREAMQVHSMLVDQNEFHLPPEQWQAFCDLLESPPRNIEAVHRLFADKAPWE